LYINRCFDPGGIAPGGLGVAICELEANRTREDGLQADYYDEVPEA